MTANDIKRFLIPFFAVFLFGGAHADTGAHAAHLAPYADGALSCRGVVPEVFCRLRSSLLGAFATKAIDKLPAQIRIFGSIILGIFWFWILGRRKPARETAHGGGGGDCVRFALAAGFTFAGVVLLSP